MRVWNDLRFAVLKLSRRPSIRRRIPELSLEHLMRTMALATLAAICLLPALNPTPAAADQYRWCAHYGNAGDGFTNCYFVTFQQCQWAISGNGGYCAENQFYTRTAAAPVRRKPRAH
jgi:hypothetical protein